MKKHFFIYLILFLPTLLFSQKAVFEKDKILIGDQIKFYLEIDKNKGKDIQFPVFENDIIKGIEIIERFDIEEVGDGKKLRQSYIITSFEDSLFQIEPFVFKVDGKELKTNPLILKVSNYKPDSAFVAKIDTTQQIPITDIKAIEKAPMTLKEFFSRFWWIIVIIILAIVSYFVYQYIKNRPKEEKPIFSKPKPKIPAHIIAIEKLEKLKENKLHKQEDLKPFYTEMSNIIRTYIEERFQIAALEQITSEIIDDFNKTQFANNDMNNKLKDLLSLSDMVKFAKDKPDEYKNEMMIEYAFSFVNHTKEVEEVETEKTQISKSE